MERGFTLVELAIVLVIIGLIVGGVLVGQSLIKAAEIRAVASDIQKYQTGVAAFQTKYEGIPGDLLSTSASSYGLPVSAVSPGAVGEGDGNGLLQEGDGVTPECANGAVTQPRGGIGGETTLFWRHLSEAKMIPGGYVGDGSCIDASNFGTPGVAQTALAPILPQLRIRPIGTIVAAEFIAAKSRNAFMISNPGTVNGTNGGAWTSANVLSPREAHGIDEKLDDGLPALGGVKSLNGGGGAPILAGDGKCYDTGLAPPQYAMATEDIANDAARCGLTIVGGF